MKKAITVFVVIIFIIIALFVPISYNFNDHVETFTVTDKERINTSESSKYLIMGRNENGDAVVYENTDTFWRMKFNSSNVYADIEEGKTYEVKLVGYRVPIFSWYENIIGYKEID